MVAERPSTRSLRAYEDAMVEYNQQLLEEETRAEN